MGAATGGQPGLARRASGGLARRGSRQAAHRDAEVRSPEDLANLWRWAQQNGVEIPNGYGDPSKGIRYRLPDGTIIWQRWSAESTSKPVLDFDIPSQGGYTKVHINPRGDVPDIPAPLRPGPPEPPPVSPPVETPAVTRPPSAPHHPVAYRHRSVSARYRQKSIPHPVHPPTATTGRRCWAKTSYLTSTNSTPDDASDVYSDQSLRHDSTSTPPKYGES